MNVLRDIERWFHYRVLRHPRFTSTTSQMEPLRTVCWCGVEWRRS